MNPQVQAEEKLEPTNILLLGIDTGAEGRTDQGRSDVLVLLHLNEAEEVSLISIPRDSYVNIPAYGMDRINHAYAFGGADLSVATVEQWLDTKIDAYVSVDMGGLKKIVDFIGPITVTPPTNFEMSGYTFNEGETMHLDGDQALAYSRERYNSGGDYARQGRQRELLVSMLKRLLDDETFNHALDSDELDDLLTYVDTNLELTQLSSLYSNSSDILDHIHEVQLEGMGQMIDGVYYAVISDDSLRLAQEVLQ